MKEKGSSFSGSIGFVLAAAGSAVDNGCSTWEKDKEKCIESF